MNVSSSKPYSEYWLLASKGKKISTLKKYFKSEITACRSPDEVVRTAKYLDVSGISSTSKSSIKSSHISACSLLFLLLGLTPMLSQGVEVTPFKLTGAEGEIAFRYRFDEREIQNVGGLKVFERRPSLEQEVSFLTSSYVYHPRFLEMDLGGGVRFTQNTLETNLDEIESKETLYDIVGRFRFLKNKPYPLRLHYISHNPSVYVGLADSLVVEEKKYGLDFSLLNPLVTYPMSLKAEHVETSGEGSGNIIEDSIDKVSFDVKGSFAKNGYGHLGYRYITQESVSGSANLPIQAVEAQTRTLDWDSKIYFGENQNIRLSNLFTHTLLEQSRFPERKNTRFIADLDWEHSKIFRSFYRFNMYDDSAGLTESSNKRLELGGVFNSSNNTDGSAGIELLDQKNTGFEKQSYGFNASINHRRTLGDRSELKAGYSISYRDNDQKSELAQITVLGESITLTATDTVTLNNDYVIPGSVLISNELRTQIFVEDIDYRLVVVGSETSVQRLVSGSITDGQIVLVDYAYDSGGTYGYREIKQGVQLSATFARYYNVYARYFDNEQTLTEGISRQSLNSVTSVLVGADANVPINAGLKVGLQVETEDREEVINPFQRESADMYIESPISTFGGFIRLSAKRERIDNELSLEDVDAVRYGILIRGRPTRRTDASIDISQTKDTGGTIPRKTSTATLKVTWRKRQLAFILDGRYAEEEQGTFVHDRTSIHATLIRSIR